jgi:hypothetical protein
MVTKYLVKEEMNADFWLEVQSKPKVMQTIENQLITKQAATVVEKDTGCDWMFSHARLDDLG